MKYNITDKVSHWGNGLVIGAVIIGLALLGHGLIAGKMLSPQGVLADGLLLNIGILAAIVTVVGMVSVLLRNWAKRILIVTFAAAMLIAFGWNSVLWVLIAFMSFATLGEAILPRKSSATIGSLSLQATIGAACYVLLFGILIHFTINTPLMYGALLFLPLLHRRAASQATGSLRTLLQTEGLLSNGEIAAATFLLFILALHLTGAGLPERYADGALYHLFFGQTVARVAYWPADFHSLIWALLPAGTDWLFGVGTLLVGEIGAKGISFLLFLLLLGNLFAANVDNGVKPAGSILVVALFASTPMAFIETASLFVENGLALFMFSGFVALLKTDSPPGRRVIAGVLAISAAVATKLHGAILAGPLGLIALYILVTEVPERRRLAVMGLCLVVILAGSQAYMYAYALTGNPTYPYFNAVFHSPFYPPVNFADTRWNQPPPYDLFYGITFNTERFGEFRNGAFGFQVVTLLIGSVISALLTSWRAFLAVILGLVYIFGIAINSSYARYLYPGLPLLVVGTASLLASDARVSGLLTRTVIGLSSVVIAALTVLNLAFFSTAGWPLSQNFWSGLFDREKWQEAGDKSLPQLALNRRVSSDGLPVPRHLLFNDAVSAGLAGIPLTVNWYNERLVDRFRKAHSIAEIEQIIRDYRVTHASFRLEPSPYGIDMELVAKALSVLGEPIAREGKLVLYRLRPDFWLGPNLMHEGQLTSDQAAWEVSGNVEWAPTEGAVLGVGASLQQSIEDPLKLNHLYRLSVEMNCSKPEQGVHVAVLFNEHGRSTKERIDDFPPCDMTGKVERTLDFVSPSHPTVGVIIVDTSSATFLRATLRQGYPMQWDRKQEHRY